MRRCSASRTVSTLLSSRWCEVFTLRTRSRLLLSLLAMRSSSAGVDCAWGCASDVGVRARVHVCV